MEDARKSPGAALVLSLVPGVGHIYSGATGSGIAWLAACFLAYQASNEFGVVLHVICALTAAQAAQSANRREEDQLARRRENAAEVARLLDDAVARGGGAPPPPP